MLSEDLWPVVLNPVFLITMALVLAPFLPLAYSVWRTWEENRPKRESFRIDQVTMQDTSSVITTSANGAAADASPAASAPTEAQQPASEPA